MYRRPKFLEILQEIREQMSREADYDMDLFAEMVRSGVRPRHGRMRYIRGVPSVPPPQDDLNDGEASQDKSGEMW